MPKESYKDRLTVARHLKGEMRMTRAKARLEEVIRTLRENGTLGKKSGPRGKIVPRKGN